MKQKIAILIITLLNMGISVANPVVTTSMGKIIGKTAFFEKIPVFTFQSIPFAKPPVGALRFKKPVPVEPWNKPLHATHLPPGCIQYSSNPFPWLDDLPGKSEDCLYLNIWTPANSCASDMKSVMFFIHGGGFRISSSRVDFYDGRVMAALGDVIVVTTNFRLGPQGFLYSGTDDAPGNMGLYDILEALKWVHSNIRMFGGNRNDVTLFGQSAGAIAISMFMTSPLFKGLFVRAIMESGSATNLDAEDNDKDFTLSQSLAKAVGCADSETALADRPEEVVKCLRDKDGLELVKTVGKVSKDPQRSLYPRFGDEILPQNARQSIIEGKFLNIDVLIGSNSNEGSTMITKAFKSTFGFFGEKDPQINKTFGEDIMRKNFRNFHDADAVIEHYLKDVDENDYNKIRYQVQAASGEYARVCPIVYLAERLADNGNNVYYYVFGHRPYTSPFAPWMGVVHFDETPFVFGYPLRYPGNYTVAERQLSHTMLLAWTNFAKLGHPNLQPWPLYSKKSHLYHLFRTDRIAVRAGPHLKNCDFFRRYFGF